jgi:hypothetical protein
MKRLPIIRSIVLAGIVWCAAKPVHAQTRAAADSLLQKLTGRWLMTGDVMAEAVTHDLAGRRVLDGQFVELHIVDRGTPPGYEARVFIGADSLGNFVAHWLDSFGAAASIPHATGRMRGDTMVLIFPYASGNFRDTFTYDRARDTWHFLLESESVDSGWRKFAEYRVTREP